MVDRTSLQLFHSVSLNSLITRSNTNQSTQEVKKEGYLRLIRTRQISANFVFNKSDKPTNRYKTRHVVNTDLNGEDASRMAMAWYTEDETKNKLQSGYIYIAKSLPHFVFYICLFVRRYVEGKICRKCAHCFV